MLKVILTRLRQGYRTIKFPAAPPPPLPDRFRGRPELAPNSSGADWAAAEASCPTGAFSAAGASVGPARAAAPAAPTRESPHQAGPSLDLGRCIFCGACERASGGRAVTFSRDYRLATRRREALLLAPGGRELELAEALGARLRRLFGRSFKLRQVSAGGCNACEADLNVLTTVGWDIGRFGIQFVASPRHADGLVVTGPVTKNMALALRKTYDAMPEPRIVIASGACAIAGGPYRGSPEVSDGVAGILPVDLFIPGCPPHPLTVLDALLRLVGRRKEKQS